MELLSLPYTESLGPGTLTITVFEKAYRLVEYQGLSGLEDACGITQIPVTYIHILSRLRDV